MKKVIRIALTFLCMVNIVATTYALPPNNSLALNNIEQLRNNIQEIQLQSRTITNVIRGAGDVYRIGQGVCVIGNTLAREHDQHTRFNVTLQAINTAIQTACESFGQTAGHTIAALILEPSLCNDALPSWQKIVFLCGPVAAGLCGRRIGTVIGQVFTIGTTVVALGISGRLKPY